MRALICSTILFIYALISKSMMLNDGNKSLTELLTDNRRISEWCLCKTEYGFSLLCMNKVISHRPDVTDKTEAKCKFKHEDSFYHSLLINLVSRLNIWMNCVDRGSINAGNVV